MAQPPFLQISIAKTKRKNKGMIRKKTTGSAKMRRLDLYPCCEKLQDKTANGFGWDIAFDVQRKIKSYGMRFGSPGRMDTD